MNPYISTKKQPNKNNSNHYIRWVMVTIILLLIIFFSTGCSKSDDKFSGTGTLSVNGNSSIEIDTKNTMLYNQRYNQSAVSDAISVQSASNGNSTTTQFNLTDLGLSADKVVTIKFIEQ